MTADLLLEIGTEDLPAWSVKKLSMELAYSILEGIEKRKISCRYLDPEKRKVLGFPRQLFAQAYETRSKVFIEVGDTQIFEGLRIFATPRRITVLIEAVAKQQPDVPLDRWGPAVSAALKDGKPTQAALGFAKSCGVEFSALSQVGGKLYFSKTISGKATREVVSEIFEDALKQMDELVPKRMRWGTGEETFVRPVQWLACMLGGKVVPLKRFGLKASNKTYGHRFHAPKAMLLKSPAEYEKKLKAAKVWVDFESRRAEIWKQIEAEAKKLKGTPHKNDDLLNEVTALVEWPVTIHGRMEERFMQLPPEVIIATIEHNQRYFPVFDKNRKLLPYFITVSNIKSKDVQQVIAGNERVVTPRLADALFFWEQDLKQPLEDYGEKLKTVTFQKELGSVADKVLRVRKLAAHVAELLSEDKKSVERAAQLCKNDLVTRMVYEFPELQGIVGGYYAEKSGEPSATSAAVREHYLPTQQGTPIPTTRQGQILALADKLDTLAGIFAIGQKPTASKDPFALRRAALGVLRICIEGEFSLDLRPLFKIALENQPAGKRDETMLTELTGFVMERLRGLLAEQTVSVEVFNAVAATGITTPTDFVSRSEAVRAFQKVKESEYLAAAHKRIRNILKQAGEGSDQVKPEQLTESAEKNLHRVLTEVSDKVQQAAVAGDYAKGLKTLAQLQAPVDAFFDKVMVMTEDAELRANRLALLRNLDRLCRSIADISCLPGQT